MHLNGKTVKIECDLKGKTCRIRANELKIYVSEEKNWTPGVGLPPPRGNIHVYNHNIQTSFFLKPLGRSKLNFIRSNCRKGEPMRL